MVSPPSSGTATAASGARTEPACSDGPAPTDGRSDRPEADISNNAHKSASLERFNESPLAPVDEQARSIAPILRAAKDVESLTARHGRALPEGKTRAAFDVFEVGG